MEIKDYLKAENIFLSEKLKDKESVLRFIAEACAQNNIVDSADTLFEGLQHRERTLSTGVGGGIGFPHTTSAEAKEPAVLLLRLAKPVDFEALDKRPVDIILALIIPEADQAMHIRILARVSRLCKAPEFLSAVRDADDAEKLLKEINKIENNII